MSKELFEAINLLEQEKGISSEYLYETIKTAIVKSVKHNYGNRDVVHCEIDPEKDTIKVFVRKEIVEEVEDEYAQISLEDALQIKKSAKVGKTIDFPIKTKDLGRVVAGNAKNTIRQEIKRAEKEKQVAEFIDKKLEVVSGKVQKVDPERGNALLEIGSTVVDLPLREQIPGEVLNPGDIVKVYIVDVKTESKKDSKAGPRIIISRTHQGLVRKLFESEVPEIYDGTIEIHSVSREAGSRSKIAVYSKDEDVDPVGACIGPKGQRVSNIVDALGGEKIDIVKYSPDPAEFVAAALAPSDVCDVEILDANEKTCRATVPDDQLSLAIGNSGQNVRLAVKLTGWNIDIKPESGFYEGSQE